MKTRVIVTLLLILIGSLSLLAQSDSMPAITTTSGLQTDSAYRAFVLDSLRLVQEQELAALRSAQPSEINTEGIIGVFIPIIAILAVFFYLWKNMEAKKAVRLAMVERGMDPSLLNTGSESTRKYGAMRIGLLLTGTGLGLLIGMGISVLLYLREEQTVFVVMASALVFGGAGLIIYHRMIASIEQKTPEA